MFKKVEILSLAATMVLAVACLAQQSAPAPSPEQKDAHATAAPAQQPAYETSAVLKVKSRLVVVDVVARDSKGLPVTDLKQEDFTVLEDGKEQKLRIFSFQHPDDSVATAQPLASSDGMNVVDNLPHFQARTRVERHPDGRSQYQPLESGLHAPGHDQVSGHAAGE